MRNRLTVLLGVFLLGCVDLTFTVKVPCHASFVRPDSLSSDTLAVWKADTLGCPR